LGRGLRLFQRRGDNQSYRLAVVADLCTGSNGRASGINYLPTLHSRSRSWAAGFRLISFGQSNIREQQSV